MNLKMQQDPQQNSAKRVGASIDADGLSPNLHCSCVISRLRASVRLFLPMS